MLTKLEKKDFDAFFKIMEEAFPTDERRPYLEEYALLSNKKFLPYVLKNDDKIIGFITVYDFSDFVYVEHFAISSEYRNQGVGSKILSELSAMYSNIVLEVEPPTTEQAVKRIAFYKRNGFCLSDYSYMQPPISKGKKEVPLMIMSSFELDEAAFSKIKQTLYTEVYHVV